MSAAAAVKMLRLSFFIAKFVTQTRVRMITRVRRDILMEAVPQT